MQGFLAAGYHFANMDDGWAGSRAANGTIIPDPKMFPGGLRAFVQAMNSRGFRAGVYTDRGTKTCGGRPGSEGFETNDAQAYVAAGVEYVKEDSCYASADHLVAYRQYATMRDALKNASSAPGAKPVFFSLCGWSTWYGPVGAALGNSWRIGRDDTDWSNVLVNIDAAAQLAQDSGPGGWNDPCLLLGATDRGNELVTEQQSVTQFLMWAMVAAPLLLSQSITNMTLLREQTYLNPEIIAINQDRLGRAGQRVVGGPLTGNGADPPARVAACSMAQQWTLFESGAKAGYIGTSGNVCLNVDNCGTSVIGYECLTAGGTCCGPSCYKNLQWHIKGADASSASIVSGLDEYCLTPGQDGTITLAPCDGSAQQLWDASALAGGASGPIKWLGSPGGACLSLDAPSTTTNIWGRRLANGDAAVAFINVGPAAASIACDSDCLAEITGWNPSLNATIRDVVARSSTGKILVGSGLPSVTLGPDEAALWRISPTLD